LTPSDTWGASAVVLGQLALDRQARGETTDCWRLVPQYYRPSAAEEKRKGM
jgi:hypothetical protein